MEIDPRASEDRAFWVHTLTRIAEPVLRALSRRELKRTMPVEGIGDVRFDRSHFSHLEAMARTLTGLAPWLESGMPEGYEEDLRLCFASLAREAIDAATDPDSPDFANWGFSFQPIVDAAFLSHALLRAPKELLERLEPRIRANLAAALRATRTRKPVYNNWLLFAAMIEAALCLMGEEWDRMRVDYAFRQHEAWYLGDGIYGDGPDYHADYYNSFVIQPMLVDILSAVSGEYPEWEAMEAPVLHRARRYAEILERTISPDGTFPPLGRSLAYRFGAFQHLSQTALQGNLPESTSPAQVRSALTAVIRRVLSVPGNFDEAGWLKVGFCGSQPSVGEAYISTGSLYLCTGAFVALGLPPDSPFWAGAPEPWTQVKIWTGADVSADHSLGHEVF